MHLPHLKYCEYPEGTTDCVRSRLFGAPHFLQSTNFAREQSFMKEIFPECWRLILWYDSIALSPPLSACSLDSDPVSDSSGSWGNIITMSPRNLRKSSEMLYPQRHYACRTWLPPDQPKLKERSNNIITAPALHIVLWCR